MVKFVKVKQGELDLFLFSVSVEEIVNNTTVSIFSNENPKGYQRPLSKIHVSKIVRYLASEETPIITSSFILATDRTNLEIDWDKESFEITGPMRLVDGQHRAEAFRELKSKNNEKYQKVKNLELPATLIVSSDEDNLFEIQAFLDLNSKGKKVSTDLAIRLRDEIRSSKGIKDEDEAFEHICTNAVLKLDRTGIDNVWYKSIKTEPLDQGRIVSINAFVRSLRPVLNAYLSSSVFDLNASMQNNESLESISDEFYEFLRESWNIVYGRWPNAFKFSLIKADKNYVLQKGMGVNSIHLVLAELLSEFGRFGKEEVLYRLKKILDETQIESGDWLVGGSFTGYSSQSGYKRIKDMILGYSIGQEFFQITQ